jgi:hypothetical protein
MGRSKTPDSRTSKASPYASHELHGPDHGGLLDNIDKLLNSVAELMTKEPALDRQAFEHLRQLRVRIRYAMQAPESDIVRAILAAHPPKFIDRIDKHQDVVSFLRTQYSRWLGTEIPRSELKKIDKSLYDAVTNWSAKHGGLPADINFPTKAELIHRKLLASESVKAPSRSRRIAEMSPSDRERVRLYDVVRRRKKGKNG